MKMITISEVEYLQLKQTVTVLQQQLALFQDQDFRSKLSLAYQLFLFQKTTPIATNNPNLSIRRGSAKHAIGYIAEDFTALLDDFKDYM